MPTSPNPPATLFMTPTPSQYTLFLPNLSSPPRTFIVSRNPYQPTLLFFFFNDTPPTEISPLPLHAALPILRPQRHPPGRPRPGHLPRPRPRPPPRPSGSRHDGDARRRRRREDPLPLADGRRRPERCSRRRQIGRAHV